MQGTHQLREGAVVVGVPVTNDQGVGLGRIDFEYLVVVGETLPGPGEVEEDLLRGCLRRSCASQMPHQQMDHRDADHGLARLG